MNVADINPNDITINYRILEDCKRAVKKMCNSISDYDYKLYRDLINPLSKLLDDDDEDHIDNIIDYIHKKRNDLEKKEANLQKIYSAISNFIEYAQRADKYVSDGMKEVTKPITDNMGALDTIASNIYNTFCVDLANSRLTTRLIADMAKTAQTEVNIKVENLEMWFQHGDGQYVWNIFEATIGAIAAIGCAIAAILAIPFSGGATIPIVIGCIGAAASVGSAAITSVNSIVKIHSNLKAYNADDPASARYLGSVEGLSDKAKKTDFGIYNDAVEGLGGVLDGAETFFNVVGFATGLASLGNVKCLDTKKITGYKLSKENVLNNIKSSMGYDLKKGKWDMKSMFLPNLNSDDIEDLYSSQHIDFNRTLQRKAFMINKPTKDVMATCMVADAVRSKVESVKTLNNISKSNKKTVAPGEVRSAAIDYDTLTNITNLASLFPAFSLPKKVLYDN